jgi:predicted TIM-barrel fold metal-dependent hydrolase
MGILRLPYGIDSDVHLSSPKSIEMIKKHNPAQYRNGFVGTVDQYITEEMAPLGIESAWIWFNPHGSLFDKELYEKENQHIYEISTKYKNLHPFGWLTYFKDERSEKRHHRLRQFFDEYGFCGVKINIEDAVYTKHESFRLNNICLGPELEFIAQNYPNKIITSHTGMNVENKKAHPSLIGVLAKQYTTLRFVMVHTGACPGAIVNDYHIDAIHVMQQNENVSGILSMINPASVLDVYRAVRDGVIKTDQVLVGSDYPYNKAVGTLDSRYNLACHPELEFSESQIHMIMSENAKTLVQQSKSN